LFEPLPENGFIFHPPAGRVPFHTPLSALYCGATKFYGWGCRCGVGGRWEIWPEEPPRCCSLSDTAGVPCGGRS